MLIKLKAGGEVNSVSQEEGLRLIAAGLATLADTNPPAKKRENALQKSKREKR